jgi:hypothetical protein
MLWWARPDLEWIRAVVGWACAELSMDLFVVYLTTLFQYLRLYSVDFYSSLICLPSSSEAGETRVRNMAAEFLPTSTYRARRVL